MDPERWRRIQELFHRVADLPAGERERELDRACAGDRSLHAEVTKLLANDAETDERKADLFSRLDARPHAPAADPFLGRTLGAFRIVAPLGAGGMGVVYRAQRIDGLFQQEVAVKLIRAEHATPWMLRRFEFERRTLAALEHPSIARLYDGGTTDDGSPYFVMELVRGEPIDRYGARERLSLEARLRLFVQVCRAVQYAHQNLVVHCDLKPANILIDGAGVPRLLDFGIARLLEQGPQESLSADDRSATATIAHVLTPEYASPEQLAGGAVTTAIDIYSLGVVLYELIAGCRPFESDSRSLVEWERIVRERSPTRPSARLAGNGRTAPGGVPRGDLDRIVLMALRKEPERRYASAQEFADDIERYLARQPVRARPNSVGYLASKFVVRNRIAVGAALAVVIALFVGLLAARKAERLAEYEAVHARMEADSFQSIASFLMDGFLPAQPAEDPAWQARARERVLAQSEQVRRQYASSPHQRANLLDTLGQVCRRLDLAQDALALMNEALAIREATFGADSLEYAISLRSLGQRAYDDGAFAEAAEYLEKALRIHRAAGDDTHADVASIANDLAACLRNIGREKEAESLHREALALRRDDGDVSLPVAESLNNLAGIHVARSEFPAAIELLREALAIRSAILGEGHLLTSQTISNLAIVHWRNGDQADALAMMTRAESGYRSIGVDGEDGLAVVLANHAAMQIAGKDLDGAAASLEEALTLQRKRLRADHPLIATSLVKLAALHHARQRDDLAKASWEEVLRVRRAPGGSPRELAEATYGYAVLLSGMGECGAARPLLDETVAIHATSSLDDPLGLGRAQVALAGCLESAGESAAAIAAFREAERLLTASGRATEFELRHVAERLAALGATPSS